MHRLTSLFSFPTTLLILLSAILTACGGGSGSSTAAPPPPASPPPPPPPAALNPVYSEIQASVFTPTCAVSGCHTGAGAPVGLMLDETNSYALLVGVASGQASGVQRVAPGDPDNSYLIQKLEGTAAGGSQMPLNGTPLPQATIDVMRQWIIDGALDDRAPASTPIRVSSLSPVPDSALTAAPTQILAGFDRELDASSVNANSFVLEASGGDTTFGEGNEVAVTAASISVPGTNPMTAVFDLTGVALADDTYQVRLLGSGPSIIMDLDANALDGEFTGAFPSGDGTAGGDFAAEFTLNTASSAATFDDIQANVFTPTCATAGCHSGAAPPEGLNLEAGNSFALLVGVASSQVPAVLRVAAGDPDNSYLVQKLEGAPGIVNSQMPLVGGPLDPALIADIREWITDGANP